MTITESLLPRLSDWHPAGDGRHSCATAFPDQGWSVGIAADRADSLACLVWEMVLTRTAEPASDLTLEKWAHAITGRAAGLTELLSVYEIDEPRGEAILRSKPPTLKGESLSYFEVRLAGLRSATVRRFTAKRDTAGRTQVPFAITHEALARLAGDLAG